MIAEPLLDAPEDEEDEETLQLRLQAIEARLKLRRLRQKANSSEIPNTKHRQLLAQDINGKENVYPPSISADIKTKNGVQIPVSPQRKAVVDTQPRSPGRLLLGIDKGLKGRNVSLRNPTSGKASQGHCTDRIAPRNRIGEEQDLPISQLPRKSFNDRLRESRDRDKIQQERDCDRHMKRSHGFGIAQSELDASQKSVEARGKATTIQDRDVPTRDGFSRAQILQATKKEDAGVVRRQQKLLSSSGEAPPPVWINPNAEPEIIKPDRAAQQQNRESRAHLPPPKESTEPRPDEAAEHLFEPFSSTKLSKRLITHTLLTKTFKGKSLLRVLDLLAKVKSPEYLLPDDLEADYVVLGIIASKSSPLNHKERSTPMTSDETTSYAEAEASSQNARGKYMVLQLTDLKWTVDLYLFTTAYTRFYKLTPGTVVAILNPGIMPPPAHKTDSGHFSLTLNSSDDTVLEIGNSRDLGWCKATRKDGSNCPDWVDKRHTEFCEFHVDRAVERNRRGRMEVNGLSAPFAPGGRKKGRTGRFGGGEKGMGPQSRSRDWGFKKKSDSLEDDELRPEGQRYDRTTSSRYFIAPPMPGGSAAQLLDREDMMIGRGTTKAESLRKRLAEQEKEKEMAKSLSDRRNGPGSEYLRLRQQNKNDECVSANDRRTREESNEDRVDASNLGLLGNKAKGVHLSPIKNSNLKRKGVWPTESARKKTRFVMENGIKEAGRDSLDGRAKTAVVRKPADEDDDLEIE